jgi:uncharacterized protein YraI
MNVMDTLKRNSWLVILTVVFFVMITVALGIALGGFTAGALDREPTPGSTAIVIVQPTMLLSPTSGAPGTTVTLASAGWQPGETILVRLGNPQTGQLDGAAVLILETNERGEVSGTFVYPVEERWAALPSALVVLQATSGSATTSATFQVASVPAPVTETPGVDNTPTTGTVPEVTATAIVEPTTPPPSSEPATALPTLAVPATVQPTATLPEGGAAGPDDAATLTSDANVRRGPGTSYAVITVGASGTELTVLGQNSEGDWLQVALPNGTTGWVSRALTDFTGAAPVVATPAPPAPTNTPPAPAATATATRPNPTTTTIPATATATRPNPTNTPNPTQTATPAITAWRGEYYTNRTLAGAPALVRNDNEVNFNWGTVAPAAGLPADGFSARWSRELTFEEGLYRFRGRVDDGMRLYVDGALVIDAWQNGPSRDVQGDVRLTAGTHSVRVEYYENEGTAQVRAWWERLAAYPEWKGEYWNNLSLSGNPALVRNDTNLDFNWGGGSPASAIPADNFSARWTRSLHFEGGSYRFAVAADDGVRLWIDDVQVINEWSDGGSRDLSTEVALTTGTHSLRLEYYERTGDARVRLGWEKLGGPTIREWKGEYWTNGNLSGTPALVRNDREINFNWGTSAPAAGLPADGFSVRWTRELSFAPGSYRLTLHGDDGFWLFVDDREVLKRWFNSENNFDYVDLSLNGNHRITVLYYDYVGDARIRMGWELMATPTPTATNTLTPTRVPSTSTPTRVPPTNTPTNTPTRVPPTSTPTSTPTQVPPTHTPTNTPTRVPPTNTPTNTQVPPTSTPTSTTVPPTSTPTQVPPTATPTSTVAPQPTGVRLNELLTVVGANDWNKDGVADQGDQWLELHNAGTSNVNLNGWALRVGANGPTYRFTQGTNLKRGEFLVLYGKQTGLVLSETGGTLALLNAAGAVVDTVTYPALNANVTYNRNQTGGWAGGTPSPNAPNTALVPAGPLPGEPVPE